MLEQLSVMHCIICNASIDTKQNEHTCSIRNKRPMRVLPSGHKVQRVRKLGLFYGSPLNNGGSI